MKRSLCLASALALFAWSCFASPAQSDETWRYVDQPSGADRLRPLFQSVALEKDPPDGIVRKIAYRGDKQLYGQVRYGDDDSTRVLLVVDEVAQDDFDLYVDADRDRVINAKEQVAGQGRDRTLEIAVEFGNQDAPTHRTRQVLVRRPRGEDRLSVESG